MEDRLELSAWIESENGDRFPVEGSCSFGRSRSNAVVLASEKVSRRHAVIHVQEKSEYWLIDLGSSNGTYLNERRVTQPCQLKNKDRIQIGDFVFRFHHTLAGEEEVFGKTTEVTMEHIRTIQCFMLVADIASSTQLVKNLSPEEMTRVTGQWLSECKRIIDANGGAINKFLGDGFFAYWIDSEDMAVKVAAALNAFRELQDTSEVVFRIVLHYANVYVRGIGSLGEDSLYGMEVNFVFRIEKTAGSAGLTRMLSKAAQHRLETVLPAKPCGRFPVHSFEGEFEFFTF